MCNDTNIIATLKDVQAFVPDLPRNGFIAPFSPDLEVRREVIPPDLRILLASRGCIHVPSQTMTFGPSKWSRAYSLLAHKIPPPCGRCLTSFKDHCRVTNV